jgi:hypothetical protein
MSIFLAGDCHGEKYSARLISLSASIFVHTLRFGGKFSSSAGDTDTDRDNKSNEEIKNGTEQNNKIPVKL